MTTPNMLTVTTTYGKTAYITPPSNTSVVLLANAVNSNTLVKVNSILVANADGSNAINASVSIYSNGAVGQGSTPSGGIAYPIISTVSVPANASLIAVDRTASIYLEENNSIVVTSGAANKLTFIVGYEVLS
jgi:hypothetical protein